MNKYVNGVLVEMTDAEIAQFNAEQHTETELKNEKWASIRRKRNQLLSESDWIVTKASETGVAVSDEWKTYRQSLRDVPSQSDPNNITWPTKPS